MHSVDFHEDRSNLRGTKELGFQGCRRLRVVLTGSRVQDPLFLTATPNLPLAVLNVGGIAAPASISIALKKAVRTAASTLFAHLDAVCRVNALDYLNTVVKGLAALLAIARNDICSVAAT